MSTNGDNEDSLVNLVEAKEHKQLEAIGVESDLEQPTKKDSGVDPSLGHEPEQGAVQEKTGSKKKPCDTSDNENVDAFRRSEHLKKETEDQDLEMNNGEWTFLDKIPDIMECRICYSVFESPQLLTCCCRSICKKCIESHFQRTAQLADQKQTCPFCREEDVRMTNNNALAVSISQLKVQCIYKRSGCGWTGTLQNGKLHLAECDFMPVDCPNRCGCNRFERRQLAHHFQLCPFQHTKCSFEAIGCTSDTFLTREGALRHAGDSIHDHLLLIAQSNERMLKDYRSHIELAQSKSDGSSDEIIFAQNAYLASIKLTISSLKDGLQNLRQKSDLIRRNMEKEEICLVQLKAKVKQLRETEGQFKDTIAQIEAMPMPCATGISCPPVSFTINNFRKRIVTNDMWVSPPFYTHPGGYKMCLTVHPNGSPSTHHRNTVAFNIHFMTGEFDEHLQWPFPGALVTITAICQRGGNCNKSAHLSLSGNDTVYVRSKQIDGSIGQGYGIFNFIDHTHLSLFLKKDNSFEIMVYRLQFPM